MDFYSNISKSIVNLWVQLIVNIYILNISIKIERNVLKKMKKLK